MGLIGTMGAMQSALPNLFAPVPQVPEPEQPRRRGGLFGSAGRALGGLFGNGGMERLLIARALSEGDYGAAGQLMFRQRQLQAQQAEAQAEAEQRENLMNNLTKPGALGGYGMGYGEAERAMMNPQAFGAEFNTRYRTREVSEGEGVVTPGADDSRSIYTQPRHIEMGSGLVRVGGDAPPQRVYQGPTPAVENATALGLQPGTPGFDTYVRDYTLNGQGPTGTYTTRRGQDLSAGTARRGQDVSASTTRRGQDLTDARVRRGQDLTDRRVRGSAGYQGRGRGRGRAGNSAVIVNPSTGQRMQLQGGRWVPLN